MIAIGGVARSLAMQLPEDEYVAGLWRNDMPRSLLWAILKETELCERPGLYRAPSWSWVSVEGYIYSTNFSEEIGSLIIEYVSAFVSVTTDLLTNAFGKLKSSTLRLKGPLLTLDFGELSHNFNGIFHAASMMPMYDDSPGCPRFHIVMLDYKNDVLSNLHFMPICFREKTWLMPDLFGNGYIGLILAPTTDSRGHFQRRGLLWLDVSEIPMDHNPPWKMEQRHSWSDYETDHGDVIYTISIL